MSKQNTAMGRQIDMASLAAKNEQVRAVGNMNVNARGDILDPSNKVIDSGNDRISRVYSKTVSSKDMANDITPPTSMPQQNHIPPVVEKVAPKPTNIDVNELTELERQFEQLEEDVNKDTDSTDEQ